MKKLSIILLSLGLTLGASAQKIGRVGGGAFVRPRVTVIAPVYPYYGFGYGFGFGYSPFYDPFYYNRPAPRPTQLDLQLDDIKNEYKYKIATVKHDKALSKDERKQQVRDLKHQREDAIIEAKKQYYSSKKTDNSNTDKGNEQ